MKVVKGGLTYPLGFSASGIHCGIKQDKKDLALLYSEKPAKTWGVFTQNKIKAAAVLLSQNNLSSPKEKQAIIVNSGNANACTGKRGLRDAEAIIKAAAAALNIATDKVLIASTGIIGKYLPLAKINQGMAKLTQGLHKKNGGNFAQAILTTDLVAKEAAVSFQLGGRKVSIGGAAKGSGMICPNMATMLGFLTSDVNIDFSCLKQALKDSVNKSFNKITVDGDMSTNDSLFFMANGLAQNRRITAQSKCYKVFKEALDYVTTKLAKDIVKDGEGATKFIEVTVKGAKSRLEAGRAAYAIANSTLVKTALFGENPNWGRIMAALGYSGAKVIGDKIDIYFNDKLLVKNGVKRENTFKNILKKKNISVSVDLKIGREKETVWTSDLSYDYVRINL